MRRKKRPNGKAFIGPQFQNPIQAEIAIYQNAMAEQAVVGDIRGEYLSRCRLFGSYALLGDGENAMAYLPDINAFPVESRDDCSDLIAETLFFRLNDPRLALSYIKRAYQSTEREPDPSLRGWITGRLHTLEFVTQARLDPTSEPFQEATKQLIARASNRSIYVDSVGQIIRGLIDGGRVTSDFCVVLRAYWADLKQEQEFDNADSSEYLAELSELIRKLKCAEPD